MSSSLDLALMKPVVNDGAASCSHIRADFKTQSNRAACELDKFSRADLGC